MSLLSTRNLVVLVAISCIALVALLSVGSQAAAVAKIIASTTFIALAIQVGGFSSTYGRLILLGLCLSWFGDVFLINSSQIAFLAGLVAFLLAHVAYIAAFIARGINIRWALSAALPVAAIAVVASIWLSPHVAPYLLIPVRVYTAVISFMVIGAIGTRGRGAPALILVGALLFFTSDLSVAALRLVQSDFPTYVWGLPFYYAGQVCLALSASQSRSH